METSTSSVRVGSLVRRDDEQFAGKTWGGYVQVSTGRSPLYSRIVGHSMSCGTNHEISMTSTVLLSKGKMRNSVTRVLTNYSHYLGFERPERCSKVKKATGAEWCGWWIPRSHRPGKPASALDHAETLIFAPVLACHASNSSHPFGRHIIELPTTKAAPRASIRLKPIWSLI